MKESFPGGDFLKKKYDLHNAPEVEEQTRRTEALTGEAVPQDPASRIKNYLDRFGDILEREDPSDRERGVEALKRILHRNHVVKPGDIPESYFDAQRRIAREQGHGDVAITREMRDQLTEVAIADQESTLDAWVDYFASPDALYPTWLKYWATREILKMGGYDKERHEFSKRSKGTTKPFPDLNREALAYVLDAVEKKYAPKTPEVPGTAAVPGTSPESGPEFEKLLQSESFSKLYAWAIEKVTPATQEQLENPAGEWKRYPKGSDHMPLVESLQAHGTGWCTAGESTAKMQLQGGDFHVYYSHDKDGKPTIPRAAIRMQGDSIAEVRGVAAQQNLDPYIGGVVQEKMKEFPDGAAYEKKAADMKGLTVIERKMNAAQPLTKDDLRLLYELDGPIQGFGYGRDPRVKELRDKRNPKEDAPILFDCAPDQISWSKDAVTDRTKAYVGPLFPGVFEKLGHLKHLYTRFPEGRVERRVIEIGGMTAKQYEAELTKEGFKISDYAKDILEKMKPSKERRKTDIVRLTVADLGFTKATRYDEICRRAKELGLELSPAEVGPELRLVLKNQPMNDWFRVAMEPITGSDGDPRIFSVARGGDGSWLDASHGRPGSEWDPVNSFAFVPRKQSLET